MEWLPFIIFVVIAISILVQFAISFPGAFWTIGDDLDDLDTFD